MDEAENLSLEAIGAFGEAGVGIEFEGVNRREIYGWVERLLGQHERALQGKAARGSVAALRREDHRLEFSRSAFDLPQPTPAPVSPAAAAHRTPSINMRSRQTWR